MTTSKRAIQLAAYADGELDPSQHVQVEKLVSASREAATQVEQTRGLRHALHRALTESDPPLGLRAAVLSRLAAERSSQKSRVWKLAAAWTFAAAAVFWLTLTATGPDFWSRPRVAPPPIAAHDVSVTEFVRSFVACETTPMPGACDEYRVAGKSVADANRLLRTLQVFPKPNCVLPDLTESGFALAGVSAGGSSNDVAVLEAIYRNDAAAPLAFFISSRLLNITTGAAAVATREFSDRRYQVATLRDDLVIVKWDDSYCSFVLCGRMPAERLLAIAAGMDPISDSAGLACLSFAVSF